MAEMIEWEGFKAEDLRSLDWKFIFGACNSPDIGDFKFIIDKTTGELHLLEIKAKLAKKLRPSQIFIAKMEDLIEVAELKKQSAFIDDDENVLDLSYYKAKALTKEKNRM
jgi:hypothetical protein